MMCAQCDYTSETEEHLRFCPACGTRLFKSKWRQTYHVGLPLLTAIATWVPWIRVGLGSHQSLWTVYQVSSWAWLWLVVDLFVMAISAWPRVAITYRAERLWQLVGAGTLAVGISVLVSTGMANKVSVILGAPSPIHLSVGLLLFVCIVGVWAILAVLE